MVVIKEVMENKADESPDSGEEIISDGVSYDEEMSGEGGSEVPSDDETGDEVDGEYVVELENEGGDDDDDVSDDDDSDGHDDDNDDSINVSGEDDDYGGDVDDYDDDDLSGDDDNEKEEADVKDSAKQQGIAGMADVISKILGKDLAEQKGVVLSKCKQSRKRKTEDTEERETKKSLHEQKLASLEKNHIVPNRTNAQMEVLLRRIATKGVVKLFNAVSTHQKKMNEKMTEAKTESRKSKAAEKVTKSSFLDMLKDDNQKEEDDGLSKSKKKKKVNKEEKKEEEKPAWAVLQDNFMMASKMKDWDKEDEENGDEQPASHHDDSDDDSE